MTWIVACKKEVQGGMEGTADPKSQSIEIR